MKKKSKAEQLAFLRSEERWLFKRESTVDQLTERGRHDRVWSQWAKTVWPSLMEALFGMKEEKR